MKAGVLAINLSLPCNAACPFCISRMTYKPGGNNDIILSKIKKAVQYAMFHDVDTAMITGIGEPLLYDQLPRLIETLKSSGMPIVELQTNGTLLTPDLCKELSGYELDVISVSAVSTDRLTNSWVMNCPAYDIKEAMQAIKDADMISRLSMNISRYMLAPENGEWTHYFSLDTPGWPPRESEVRTGVSEFLNKDIVSLIGGIHQLTFRELGAPVTNGKAAEWVNENRLISKLIMFYLANDIAYDPPLRDLPYGAKVYDWNGIGVCFTTCLTNTPDTEHIRTLILQPDGHIYHSWDLKGSILL